MGKQNKKPKHWNCHWGSDGYQVNEPTQWTWRTRCHWDDDGIPMEAEMGLPVPVSAYPLPPTFDEFRAEFLKATGVTIPEADRKRMQRCDRGLWGDSDFPTQFVYENGNCNIYADDAHRDEIRDKLVAMVRELGGAE